MPGSYEGGLRLVEHYAGRAAATKQTRGVFPTLSSAPDMNVGRVVKNASNRLTGTAAQTAATVSHHGVRPTATFNMDVKPEDVLLPLMSFFHNRKYTVVTPGTGSPSAYASPYTEIGTYQFAMIDAKPDASGAVIGTYDDAAASYKEQVAMSDVYSIGLEFLYGHGDLGNSNNALFIENFVANEITFQVDRGIDQFAQMTVAGFGRDGDEVASVTEAAWGPGVNGSYSSQNVMSPDEATITVLSLNSVDKLSTFSSVLDGLTITMNNGLGGRDALGSAELNGLTTEGRPTVSGSLRMAHVAGDFLTALKNGHKFELTVQFYTGTNEYVTIELPYLKLHESFAPQAGDAEGGDVSLEVPFMAVIDPAVVKPLVEVEVSTTFDVRTNSFFLSDTLADASTYTV